MITRPVGYAPTAEAVREILAEHDLSQTRLTNLYNYFIGQHDITVRTRTTGLPNNLLVHGYPHYIATMTSGYLVGNPVKYESETPLDDLMDAFSAADVQSVDNELALEAAIYGKGVELTYANRSAEPRAAALDPVNACVVYDSTVEHLPMFGIHRVVTLVNGVATTDTVTAYTEAEKIVWKVDGVSWAEIERRPHSFGNVPMVEYWNNSVELGDYENVISLIDAYDLLQSDRVNDKQQFTDALLVLKGVAGLDAPVVGDTRTAGQRLREDKTLALPGDGAGAEWLVKTLNEADTDVLRKSINDSIHKFSLVPDLTDENFAANASGVAMRYKLLGLEQLTQVKERWFREGLRQRLRLFAHFLGIKGKAAFNPDEVKMSFHRSLPVNETEIAAMVAQLSGLVPDATLLAQIPWVQDVPEALEELQKQRGEAAKRQQEAFGMYANPDKEKGSEQEAE